MAVAIIPEKRSTGFGWLAAIFAVVLAFLVLSPVYFIFISAKPTVAEDVTQALASSDFLLKFTADVKYQRATEYLKSPKLQSYASKLETGSPSRPNPFLLP